MISAIRSHPDAIPALRASVSILLTSLIVKTFVDKVSGKENEYRHIYTTITTLGVFEGFNPTSNRDLGILATTYLVIGVVQWMFQSRPKPQVEKPAAPQSPPNWLFPSINFVSESAMHRRIGGETWLALQQLQSLKEQIFLVKETKGWDLEFLCWMISMSHHRTFYFYDGDVEKLKGCFAEHPQLIVYSKTKIEGIVLPLQVNLIVYGNEGAELPSICREEMIGLMEHWIAHYAFRQHYPNLQFEGNALRVLYDHYPQRSLFSWIREISKIIEGKEYKLIPSLEDPRLLYVYSKMPVDDYRTRKSIIEKLQALGLTCSSHNASNMQIPSFLSHIPSQPARPARAAQLRQLQAASGEDAPYTVIVGAHYKEVEFLLSQMGRLVFKFDYENYKDKEGSHEALVEFFSIYPDAILYHPTLENVIPVWASILPSVVVIGQLSHSMMNKNADNCHLSHYKRVQLIPLSQEECQTEIGEWASRRSIQFAGPALEIAIAATFLLHEENGEEYSFVKDLVERAAKISKEVTPENIWETFIPMYQLHLTALTDRNKLYDKEPTCISLIRISMALKKEFGVVLPVKKVKLSHPPEFLTDLNEKMKDSKEVLVEIPERMEGLTDALNGQYTNALIVGESGTGKTALVKLMATLSMLGKLPPEHPLHGKTIYMLNTADFTAHTKYVGEQQTKLSELFNYLMQAENSVLFIDEIHLIMGAGASEGNKMGTVSQYMKTYLEDSGVSVIGATTKKEYHTWVSGDDAFVRRFNEVVLDDPTDSQVIQILQQYSTSGVMKRLHPTLVFTEDDCHLILRSVKSARGDVSIVDRSKKRMEALAKYAKRKGLVKLTDDAMSQVALSVL